MPCSLTDLLTYYLTNLLQLDFKRACDILDEARAKNALERTGKFYMTSVQTPEDALRHVQMRSRDIAEVRPELGHSNSNPTPTPTPNPNPTPNPDPNQVRPELGHSTNAGIVVGRRELTKGRFFDRRLFLPHYDPFNDDDVGTNLATVLAPALVVGSDISNPNPNPKT